MVPLCPRQHAKLILISDGNSRSRTTLEARCALVTVRPGIMSRVVPHCWIATTRHALRQVFARFGDFDRKLRFSGAGEVSSVTADQGTTRRSGTTSNLYSAVSIGINPSGTTLMHDAGSDMLCFINARTAEQLD